MKEREHKIIKLEINKGINTNAEKNPEIHRRTIAQHCVSNFENINAMYDFSKENIN